MGILSGSKIKEEIENGSILIDPFDESKISPNSYNLTLFNKLKIYSYSKENITRLSKIINISFLKNDINNVVILDAKANNDTVEIDISENGCILMPGVLYLGSTNERISTNKYATRLDGKSSIGRKGISIHTTASNGNIGFNGSWTLEISVIHPIIIYPNIEICQLYFETVEGPTDILYNGKYQNQYGPTSPIN